MRLTKARIEQFVQETPAPVHPANGIVPNMQFHEFAALVDDIQAHGQLNPIVMLDGLILDGRQRWLACKWLGIELWRVEAFVNMRADPCNLASRSPLGAGGRSPLPLAGHWMFGFSGD